MQFALRLIHMERDAGRRIKFAPGKSLRFSQPFLGILLFQLRDTVFIPGAAERIHKSPTAREVGGWGRDPKKCTGRGWGMGSSTI